MRPMLAGTMLNWSQSAQNGFGSVPATPMAIPGGKTRWRMDKLQKRSLCCADRAVRGGRSGAGGNGTGTDANGGRNNRWIHSNHICHDEPWQHRMLRGPVRRGCGFLRQHHCRNRQRFPIPICRHRRPDGGKRVVHAKPTARSPKPTPGPAAKPMELMVNGISCSSIRMARMNWPARR